MGIGVLGTLTVDEAPAPLGRRDRVVLSALATRPGHVVSRDALVDALWREEPPDSAPKVVQGCVLRLRKVLGPDAIETAPPGYLLVEGKVEIDARRFEDAVARARDLLALGQSDRAAHAVDEALALWRGRPLPDVEDWEPGVLESSRLEDLRRDAEELRVDCYLRSGRHREVIADAAALLREAPTREARWALLARAQYQDGRQTEALATLRQASDLLAERVGIDPGPELGRLHDAMLRQDPGLLPAPQGTSGSSHCPYRGLAAYDVADADSFFGRDTDIAACLLLLEHQGVLALVGPSGGGKSSVVRAGVAATLRRQGRRVRVMTPGEAPVAALEALPRLQRGDVLVVDQCEEVFSLCHDEEQRLEFLQRLVSHGDECGPLVVAMRADRLADVTPHPAFARLVERGLYLLGALDEQGLREVIETPARDAGLLLEPGLVDLLVAEVLHEPGALPLLSHALQETWARREGHTLSVAAYRASGGIRGAVAQTAEQVYERVDPAQRHLIRELMLRLVSAGQAGEPSRIRAPRERVIAEPSQERLVDDLVGARLLTSEQGAIEIAHESLARAWPRLQDWLADDVAGQRILHHVSSAAEAWDALGRPDSELYRGTRLREALEWREHARVELTGIERDFLDAGHRAEEAEERVAAERTRRQARLIRRQRAALVAGSVFLVMALAASGVAMSQSNRASAGEEAAEASARTAETNERIAQAGRIGARALTVEDPSVALLLAAEAVNIDDNPQTRGFLRQAMARRPALVSSTQLSPSHIEGVWVDDDRDEVVVYRFDNEVARLDLRTGEQQASFDLDGAETVRSNLYATGEIVGVGPELVAVGESNYTDRAVRLLDSESLQPVSHQLSGLPASGKTAGLDASADGRWLVASIVENVPQPDDPGAIEWGPHYALVWDLRQRSRPPTVVPLTRADVGWIRVQISDDGRVLYSGGLPSAYDLRAGKRLWRRPDLATWGGTHIDLSADGERLAVSHDGVQVLDVASGEVVAHVGGADTDWVGDVKISPEGTKVAASNETDVFVWDIPTGDLLLEAEQGAQTLVDFPSNGDELHVAGSHGVETWDLEGDRRFIERIPAPASLGDQALGAMSVSDDGAHYAAVHGPDTASPNELMHVALISTRTGRVVRRVRSAVTVSNWHGETWSHDGSTYVVGSSDGRAVLVPTRGPVHDVQASDREIKGVQLDSDDRYLVTLDDSGVIRRHTRSGEVLGLPVELGGRAPDLALAPDGRTAFAMLGDPPLGPQELSSPSTWVLVDVVAGRVTSRGELPTPGDGFGWEEADFPPGRDDRVAISGWGGIQVLELGTGRPARPRVAAHTDYALGRYVANGSMVVSGGGDGIDGSGDGRVVLWDGLTGEVVDVAMIEPGAWVDAVMLDDGHTVVAVTPHAIYRWDTRIEKALEAACRAAGRSMTAVEWRTNVGDDIPYHATCG